LSFPYLIFLPFCHLVIGWAPRSNSPSLTPQCGPCFLDGAFTDQHPNRLFFSFCLPFSPQNTQFLRTTRPFTFPFVFKCFFFDFAFGLLYFFTFSPHSSIFSSSLFCSFFLCLIRRNLVNFFSPLSSTYPGDLRVPTNCSPLSLQGWRLFSFLNMSLCFFFLLRTPNPRNHDSVFFLTMEFVTFLPFSNPLSAEKFFFLRAHYGYRVFFFAVVHRPLFPFFHFKLRLPIKFGSS